MALKGKEKEVKNYKKYVGLFNAEVVSVNPSKDELQELLGTTIEKEIEYTGSNNDTGAKKVTLSFWVKEVSEGHLFNLRFYLEDIISESKTGKTQFINNIGNSSYAEDISSLPSFFTESGREIRPAKKGEENLYKFLRNWLSNLNYNDPETELSLDWKKLINGRVTELRDAISEFKNQAVCLLATVRTSDDGKEYQGVYSYEFLPEYALNCFVNKNSKKYKNVLSFIEKVTGAGTNYGCKDYYELSLLHEYDPTKNVVNSSNAPILKEDVDDIKEVSTVASKEVGAYSGELPF